MPKIRRDTQYPFEYSRPHYIMNFAKRKLKYYQLVWLKHDLPAGLSVFLVALPLCLGIALASGAPLYAGILSGIIGGIIVSFVSGSHLSVSGPAAGLTTVVASAIISLGDYQTFLLAVIIAGLFQIILGLLKLGGLASYFPSAVIKGMLAAIGIILITKQIPIIMGYDKPDFWTSGFLQLFSSKNFLGNISSFAHHLTLGVIVVSILSLIILLAWESKPLQKYKIVPAALVVVIVGAIFAALLGHTDYAIGSTQLVSIPSNIFGNITFPDLSKIFSNPEIIEDGLLIGMLASLESLLCIEAIDKMDPYKRVTPMNREMVAQGVGNTVCGLLGAIPLTAVIVRGAANIDAGARTKLSSITHGLFLLFAVMLIPFLLNTIPYAALAAILLVIGFNLTKPKLYRDIWELGWKQFMPFIITIIVILSTDLLIGVAIGLLISIFFIIQRNFIIEYKVVKTIKNETEFYYIKLNTSVTFLNKVKLKEALYKVPEYSVLTIDGSDCYFIDYDVLEVISEFEHNAHEKHIELELLGIKRVNISAIH